jgi:hypothetical protein
MNDQHWTSLMLAEIIAETLTIGCTYAEDVTCGWTIESIISDNLLVDGLQPELDCQKPLRELTLEKEGEKET